jgi:hypothetical protein
MTFRSPFRIVRGLFAFAFAAAMLASAPHASARDLYKHFLDPGIPHHKAILDTLDKLEADPKNAGLHNDLACLVAWDGFWRDALREFGIAADLDRHDSRPLFNAGLVKAWKGEWVGARRAFGAATRRDPGNWPAWWMRGFAAEQLGDVEAAVDDYKTSLRMDTSLFDVAVNPFAARTKLRSRALLETYDKRLVRAAMPARQELSDPERVSSFFQKAAPSSAAPAPAPEAVATDEPVSSGPVISTVVSSSPSSAPTHPTTSAPPPTQIRPAPPRGEGNVPRFGDGPIPGVRRFGPDRPQPKPPTPGPGGADDE